MEIRLKIHEQLLLRQAYCEAEAKYLYQVEFGPNLGGESGGGHEWCAGEVEDGD